MSAEPPAGSFVRRARRAQLTEAAIAVVARLGADGASISAVAREAGVSRGTVTYHFADLAEVVDQAIVTIYARGREVVGPRMDAAEDPAARLEAFLRGSVEFYAGHAVEVQALQVIFTVPLAVREQRPEHRREIGELVALLQEGQRSGVFRPFDVPLMAAVVRGALDAVIGRVGVEGDRGGSADELALLFARATRT